MLCTARDSTSRNVLPEEKEEREVVAAEGICGAGAYVGLADCEVREEKERSDDTRRMNAAGADMSPTPRGGGEGREDVVSEEE